MLMFKEQFNKDFSTGCTVQSCMSKSVAGISKNIKYGQNEYYLEKVGIHTHRGADSRAIKFNDYESLHIPRKDQPLDVYHNG